MQASHSASAVSDDPSLVSVAGLVPDLGLARRADLHDLAAEHLSVPARSALGRQVTALVAGMVAGADSIQDMDRMRHGARSRLFTGLRAPTTLVTRPELEGRVLTFRPLVDPAAPPDGAVDDRPAPGGTSWVRPSPGRSPGHS